MRVAGAPSGSPSAIEAVLDLLRCPHCGNSLLPTGRSVRCADGHSFDLARQGYLNLLPRTPPANADTAEMVAARDRFLGRGHFAFLAAALAALVPAGTEAAAEIGAGTGYYLGRLLDERVSRGVALDISPAACRRAARTHARLGAVVADAWSPLPILDACLDVVVSAFAPRNPSEFARVLRPDGLLLTVTPMPDHLEPLRERLGLLEIETGKAERLADALGSYFTLSRRAELVHPVTLDAPAVVDLVSMGPNAFHLEPASLHRAVEALEGPVVVTLAVTVSAWRPAPPRQRPS